jgi:hypothetical protein
VGASTVTSFTEPMLDSYASGVNAVNQ